MKISTGTIVVALFTTSLENGMTIIGHRGACGYEPENTLASFQRAVDLGVAAIELDVYMCKTGQLVITHDDDVSITTDGVGFISDMTFEQIRALQVNGRGQIPTLQEVIELINRRVPINIELKGPGTAQPVAELIATYIMHGWNVHDFIISSFDHAQLSEFRQCCPSIQVGVLFPREHMSRNIPNVAAKHQANFIGLDYEAVTHDLVQLAHDAGVLVYVWTVNDKKTADIMRACNVDGIFSDYPDLV